MRERVRRVSPEYTHELGLKREEDRERILAWGMEVDRAVNARRRRLAEPSPLDLEAILKLAQP